MGVAEALPRSVLTRKAAVYVRQSTPQQMRNNLESQRRQYDLVNVARGHSFAQVEVIDDDLRNDPPLLGLAPAALRRRRPRRQPQRPLV